MGGPGLPHASESLQAETGPEKSDKHLKISNLAQGFRRLGWTKRAVAGLFVVMLLWNIFRCKSFPINPAEASTLHLRQPHFAVGTQPIETRPLPFSPMKNGEEIMIDLAGEHFPSNIWIQENIGDFDILIVGAGLSGTVLADLYARKHNLRVLVLERRPHIGGNLYDFRERRTGILTSLYGAHLFHTSKIQPWHYIHRFSNWTPYEHRVIGRVDNKLVPIPVNIDTVNLLLGENIDSLKGMQSWFERETPHTSNAKSFLNSKDVGVSRVGERLYSKLFHEYTKKQWDVFPEELGPEVLSRIPVRGDWDDRYFPNDPWQALPIGGYTSWFEQALNHPNIRVFTSVDYFDLLKKTWFEKKRFTRTFFTGQIDQFFRNKGVDLEPLQYRSIRFETVIQDVPSVAQPSFVVNYPQFKDGRHTRTAEYKHNFHQGSSKSVLIREYSTEISEGQEPYYPFPTPKNQLHFEKYRRLAEDEERLRHVHFVGRLANYKYFNMDDAIANALSLYESLEGKTLLDEALAEGQAKIGTYNAFTVHVVISVEMGSKLDWMTSFCSTLSQTFELHRESAKRFAAIKFFVYNMDRSLDTLLTDHIVQILEQSECANVKPSETLMVRNVEVSTPVMNWLDYFNGNSFSFGDANLFLQASKCQGSFAEAVQALETQFTQLFLLNMTKASDKIVAKQNIREGLEEFQNHETGTRTLQEILALSSRSRNNLLHLLPIEKEGLLLTKNSHAAGVLFQRQGDVFSDLSCHVHFGTVQFLATDAIIRRMLAVHRTSIYDSFVPKLRLGEMDISRALTQFWYCLFYSNGHALT